MFQRHTCTLNKNYETHAALTEEIVVDCSVKHGVITMQLYRVFSQTACTELERARSA